MEEEGTLTSLINVVVRSASQLSNQTNTQNKYQLVHKFMLNRQNRSTTTSQREVIILLQDAGNSQRTHKEGPIERGGVLTEHKAGRPPLF